MPSIDPDRLQQAIEQDFACLRCGHCCKGDGLVHVNSREIDAMAALLAIPRRKFIQDFAIVVGPTEWILKDKRAQAPGGQGQETWCTFLDLMPDGRYGCRVNVAKPEQCASFPRKWRNPDSLKTCAGLRALLGTLRRRDDAQATPRREEPSTNAR